LSGGRCALNVRFPAVKKKNKKLCGWAFDFKKICLYKDNSVFITVF